MADVFKDILPSIMVTKEDVLKVEKDYHAFVINRALSYHYDCIIRANQMNINHHLSGKLQYLFYINTIRPWKRPFQKWHKREKVQNIGVIKEIYQYSDEKAKEALLLLTEDQIEHLRDRVSKGGTVNGSRE